MKAIETVYNGYRFRSRLEARWALFFDAIGVKWIYEPEGFHLDGEKYLPDFFLPQVKMWAEVKARNLNTRELRVANKLCAESKYPVLMLVGAPDFVNYRAIEIDPWNGEPGTGWDYTLVADMLHENRFPCGNYIPDNNPDAYPQYYQSAVFAARAARFEGHDVHYVTAGI